MHRNQLLKLLAAYHPTHEETEYKERTIKFINTYANCFERTLAIGHITGSAFILNKAHTHALLLHHTKLDKWLQLGGHCDGDTDVLKVALREAQEESGIRGIEPVSLEIFDIDIHQIPERTHEPAHDHYDIRFLLQVTSDEQVIQNHESKELRWIKLDMSELPTREQSVLRMFKKIKGNVT
ncbi:MAG: NUDIX hydrolase [Candidatus Babeliales bacterium]